MVSRGSKAGLCPFGGFRVLVSRRSSEMPLGCAPAGDPSGEALSEGGHVGLAVSHVSLSAGSSCSLASLHYLAIVIDEVFEAGEMNALDGGETA